MRVVLDTNIFVSMLLGGRLGTLNDDWKAEKFVLVVSHAIVSEYEDVLVRPKLRLTADTIAPILDRVQRKAVLSPPTRNCLSSQMILPTISTSKPLWPQRPIVWLAAMGIC